MWSDCPTNEHRRALGRHAATDASASPPDCKEPVFLHRKRPRVSEWGTRLATAARSEDRNRRRPKKPPSFFADSYALGGPKRSPCKVVRFIFWLCFEASDSLPRLTAATTRFLAAAALLLPLHSASHISWPQHPWAQSIGLGWPPLCGALCYWH